MARIILTGGCYVYVDEDVETVVEQLRESPMSCFTNSALFDPNEPDAKVYVVRDNVCAVAAY